MTGRPLALVGLLCCVALHLAAAETAVPPASLARTQAVAFVRVTRISEELHDTVIRRVVTFALCGRAKGLGTLTELEIPLETSLNARESENKTPAAAVGNRFVVLLASPGGRWAILHQLPVSDDGKLTEGGIWAEAELIAGTKADDAVRLIGEKLDQRKNPALNRPPPPPSARNQPWNLMRASPLRRVWPFFHR